MTLKPLEERLREMGETWATGRYGDQGLRLRAEATAALLREAADEQRRLRDAMSTVIETFQRDEAQGYRSRDRQFAIEVLSAALARSGAPEEPTA